MAVSGTIKTVFDFDQTSDVSGNGTDGWLAKFPFRHRVVKTITDGTGTDQADLMYWIERTVATGANDDVDLAAALSTAFGSSFTAAELALLVIINEQADGTANTTDLTVDFSVTNGWTGFCSGSIGPICPGGIMAWYGPDDGGAGGVTGSTGDLVRITNAAGATNKYLLGLLARSA